jgi:hypothetical protein
MSKEKRFIVRKYIMAKTAHEALKKERRYRPDDVWVDEDWKRDHNKDLSSAIGFTTDSSRDYEY